MKILQKLSTLIAREAYDSDWVLPLSQRLSEFFTAASRNWIPAIGRDAGIEEMRAKIHAFGCFRNPEAWIQGPQCTLQDWPLFVEASHSFDPYTAIWLKEGWATRLIDRHLRANSEFPCLSISGAQSETLSASRLTLHTGAGMSFAKFTLSKWAATAQMPALGSVIDEFIERSGERALPNYRRCVVEPLGLVVRTLHPHLMAPISRLLSARSDEECASFWHGSGRGLYFDPIHFVPFVPMRRWSLDEAVSSAPGACARANLLSGFFWAMTLVNIQHPEVVIGFLGSMPVEHWRQDASAVADGVSAAILVWHHLTGDHAVAEHFFEHVPSRAPETLRRLWEDQIVSLARRRLADDYQKLRQEDRIADIFRFRG